MAKQDVLSRLPDMIADTQARKQARESLRISPSGQSHDLRP